MDFEFLAPLLDDFMEASGLPCAIFNTKGETLYEIARFHGVTPPIYYQYIIMDFTMQKRDEQHPLVLFFEPNYFVGIAQLAEDVYLVTAPVGPFEKNRANMMQFCARAAEPSMLVRFCDFLVSLPRFSRRKFNRAFSLLVYLCTGRYIDSASLLTSNSPLQAIAGKTVEQELFDIREEGSWHTDVDFEEGICAAVEAGDPGLLNARMGAPQHGRVGQMSLNPVTQARYTFIAFASLVTRAAIRGGLDQETAFSLSDVYCQQMDRTFDTAVIDGLSYKMALEFARRVAEKNAGCRYSPLVQKCVDYIARHLHETIRLSDLSDLCSLCTRSISAKFREEVGCSIADYITQEKMKEAQFLLTGSDYSLAEISACLQFNSQSYFTKRFREFYGMTPQKYRDLNAKR